MNNGQQFGRKATLYLTNPVSAPTSSVSASGVTTFGVATRPGVLDLSQFHFKFDIIGADTEAPNTSIIRVYNLGKNTVNTIIKEFSVVILQAGYETGNFGIIFSGNVTQYRRGKENNVDSYLEIRASDGDVPYNYGFVNFSLPAGSSNAQVAANISSQIGAPLDPTATQYLTDLAATGGVILTRGKVMFGMARAHLRDIARSTQSRWSIVNGSIFFIPFDGYLPGEVVVMNSTTGMVGVPEATDNGITVRCLLNPYIQIGQRIQINEGDVTQTTVNRQFFANYHQPPPYIANVTRDGIYRAMVVEHTGDTRDNSWFTDIICLSVDQTSLNPATGKVNPPTSTTITQTLGTVQPYNNNN